MVVVSAVQGKEVSEIRKWGADVYGMWGLDLQGERLITAGRDYSAKLWAIHSGELLHTFSGHANTVKAVALSPKGDWAASAGDNGGAIHLWDTRTGNLRMILEGHPGRVWFLRFTPNGQRVGSSSGGGMGAVDGVVRIWVLP
jgi:WD40 repeat protein